MKLLEYKGKELFSAYDIAVQKGIVAESKDEALDAAENLIGPYVLKAQVQTGGRGKAGGIKFAGSASDVQKEFSQILGMKIKGITVKKVLIAEKTEILDEWYLAIMLDRFSKCPMIIFSPLGGIDIEETAKTAPEKIAKIVINPLLGIKSYIVRYIFDKYGLDDRYFDEFYSILSNLYRLFNEYDATLLEINPLAITDSGLMAIDCKADIDDSSLYRHPDILKFRDSLDENRLVIDARNFNFLYIPLNTNGDIAVMSNGSGMLMSCIDLITKSGQTVGSALDLGGGATSERIAEAIKIIFKNPAISSLFISIFGGITRCDEVAAGVALAVESALACKTIIIRLEGTNKDAALEILKNAGPNVVFAGSITEGVKILSSRRRS
jgi:succinyl-CoA synthetase beta subunit